MPVPDITIGAVIRHHRTNRGWSQTHLANLLCETAGHHTITRHDISRWETGKRTPGPFWLRHLATVLGVAYSSLEKIRQQALRHNNSSIPHHNGEGNTSETGAGYIFLRPIRHRPVLLFNKRHRIAINTWLVRPSTNNEAESLGLPPGAPILHAIHTTRTDDGQIIETTQSTWPAERCMLIDEYEIASDPHLSEIPSQV